MRYRNRNTRPLAFGSGSNTHNGMMNSSPSQSTATYQTMRRVSSRQRWGDFRDITTAMLVSPNNSDSDSDEDYATCLSRNSSGFDLSALDNSNQLGSSFDHHQVMFQTSRKRVRIRRNDVSLDCLSVIDDDGSTPGKVSIGDALHEDLQLHVLTFLPVKDCRSIMCTSSHFYRLVMSDDATYLWKLYCAQKWSCPFTTIKASGSDLLASDGIGNHAQRIRAKQHHLSQLLRQASPHHPSHLDPVCLLPPLVQRLRQATRARGIPAPAGPSTFSSPLTHLGPNQVHYTGSVGTGDRCVKANAPLARPRRDDEESTANGNGSMSASSSSSSLSSMSSGHHHNHPFHLHNNNSHHHQNLLMQLFCRGASVVLKQSNMLPPHPFVAPFSAMDGTTVLKPRLISYFELSILEKPGSETSSSSTQVHTDCVAVGVSTEDFCSVGRMPGWCSQSWGYHGDDGGLFHGCGDMLKRFGDAFGSGDVVGCGIDYRPEVNGIFFTRNGIFLGYGWMQVREVAERIDLYPTVGVDTNCPLQTNFGAQPFRFDLQALLASAELSRLQSANRRSAEIARNDRRRSLSPNHGRFRHRHHQHTQQQQQRPHRIIHF